jgi:hypothetical protein
MRRGKDGANVYMSARGLSLILLGAGVIAVAQHLPRTALHLNLNTLQSICNSFSLDLRLHFVLRLYCTCNRFGVRSLYNRSMTL